MTYSIIGRDPKSGELGVALQSRVFAAGRLAPWIEAGIGAIASQAFAEARYGYQGLALLKRGLAPEAALAELTREDESADIRQVAIGDAHGRFAVHTGARCVSAAGHALGRDCVAQANMMTRDTVWSAMTATFEATQGALGDRLLAALDAAEREGGDIRGAQAAALIVVSGSEVENPALGRLLDLRVDDHINPLGELRRQLAYARAHQQSLDALTLMQTGDMAGARAKLEVALHAFPNEPQFLTRYALALMASGDLVGARTAMAHAISVAPHSLEFIMRMADAGLIPVPRAVLAGLAPEAGR